MTKADLIDEVSRAVDMSRKDSEVIVETIFESVVKALRGADKIEIRGFGSFRTRERRSRVGRLRARACSDRAGGTRSARDRQGGLRAAAGGKDRLPWS